MKNDCTRLKIIFNKKKLKYTNIPNFPNGQPWREKCPIDLGFCRYVILWT